ncbi:MULTISPECIES: LysR family transcriptional regulator [Rhizobium/Agrobacterium group]|uniref:HTH-type transcriptional regulator TtuA n=1 Tax=Agrobacterium fabrum TaxID=1176649 RepID=A0A7Z7BRS1_9HYPH|nr:MULTISPECIES: LysR family transcriptional regulator [Rhizobium/Agrobacterium group]NTG45383.1 LysR family transcriptional regulator [Rhizobium rhizogenes]SDK32966.1 DNA-binding transcriptional regulator, LysR family [Agrobacterium fabrum]
MQVDLKRLRYFVHVARHGSFTRAAEDLHIAQPPLSQRIRELEAEVGSVLLIRDVRPMQLTAAGRLLFEHSVQILQRTEAMIVAMRHLQADRPPVFRIGVVPTNFHGHLARLIRGYRQLLPNVELRILELNSIEQIDALLEGRIDAGISRVEIESPEVYRTILRDEPMLAALPFDHRFATGQETLSLELLKDERFILYTSNPRPSLADHILSQFAKRHIELANVVEVGQYDTALLMIAAGEGISIVPASAQLSASPDVVFRPIMERITSPIVLCHRHDDRTPELQAFHLVLKELLGGELGPLNDAVDRIGNH